MADIKESSVELIGGTPILKLNRYTESKGINDAVILAKLEYLNPAGSVKDRVALSMIEDAEKKGIIKAELQLLSRLQAIPVLDLQQLQQHADIAQYLLCQIL